MSKRKQLLITEDELKEIGINNTEQLIISFKGYLEKAILRLSRDKKTSPEEKSIEFNDLNTLIDVVNAFQKKI